MESESSENFPGNQPLSLLSEADFIIFTLIWNNFCNYNLQRRVAGLWCEQHYNSRFVVSDMMWKIILCKEGSNNFLSIYNYVGVWSSGHVAWMRVDENIVACSLKARIVESQQSTVTKQQQRNGVFCAFYADGCIRNDGIRHMIAKQQLHCNRGRVLSAQKESFSITYYMCEIYTWRKVKRIHKRQTHLLGRENVT
jgi:hypothetical protein